VHDHKMRLLATLTTLVSDVREGGKSTLSHILVISELKHELMEGFCNL